ncbi:ABC transporter ATP-binding protein [Corynebacterium terpenotabidum]|uniref:ABC transporter ATP-binding protein n=1 Tax=Corynebacterium terpenotabidum TaxID=89154 RepID=UPI001FE02275|nr:ABC transporter ATP-binding protein [Corynebacterium terpenotabidum]
MENSQEHVQEHATAVNGTGGSAAVAVIADAVEVVAEEGLVFGPLSFTLAPLGMTVLGGAGGSGRTALSLVLSGRMKPSSGAVEVLGCADRKQIWRHVALAGVDQLDELPRSVRVADILTENKSWSQRWYRLVRRATEDGLADLCSDVFGTRDLPPLDAWVSDLSSLDRLLLRICLALRPAHGGEIRMLVMDDFEQIREARDRDILLGILGRLAERMPVVLNSCNPLPETAPPHQVVSLDTYGTHIRPTHDGLPAFTTSDPTDGQ